LESNSAEERPNLPRFELLFFAALAAAVCLAYALQTQHVWEDYFITFRHSRNLAEGNGLVYHVGERVHGFTSPLGTLLPALFHRLAGNPESFWPALWAFRIASIICFSAAAALLVKTVWLVDPTAVLARRLAGLFFILEAKGVAFTVNGQETGFLLFFLILTLYLQQSGFSRHVVLGGLAWAGLQWTRPDGCVIALASAIVALILPSRETRRQLLPALVMMGIVAFLAYLPWLAGAWWYYGTPVPHTIVAKAGLAIPPWQIDRLAYVFQYRTGGALDPALALIDSLPPEIGQPIRKTFLAVVVIGDRMRERAGAAIEPIYTAFGGWSGWIARPARAAGILGLLWWLVPVRTPLGRLSRTASLLFVFLVCYLSAVQLFPWYLPPAATYLLLALATGLCVAPRTMFVGGVAAVAAAVLYDALCDTHKLFPNPRLVNGSLAAFAVLVGVSVLERRFEALRRWRASSILCYGPLLLLLTSILVGTVREVSVQQSVIEFGHRQKIGEWLKEHAKPGESIYCECLGYFGYFSNGRMHDFPGLVSPRVVKLRRQTGIGRMDLLIPVLRPDWVVLRKHEYADASKLDYVRQNYKLVQTFSQLENLRENHPNVPGRGYLEFDGWFAVLHHEGGAAAGQ
jgi:hypothetical protein